MAKALRILTAILGVFFLVQGAGFHIDAATAAEGLGMPLFEDGIARSTQVGDISAFFIATGAMILLAAYTQKRSWFYPPIMLIGGAALFRSLAVFQGAAFATQFIVPEIIMTVILVAALFKIGKD